MRWVLGMLWVSGSVFGMCPESLVSALEALNAPPSPSLLKYQPQDETVPDVRFSEPSLMVSLSGSVKAQTEVRRWCGEHPIALYGRPYLYDGEWVVDFHSIHTHKSGSRLLWRMPYLDFVEGTRLNASIPAR